MGKYHIYNSLSPGQNLDYFRKLIENYFNFFFSRTVCTLHGGTLFYFLGQFACWGNILFSGTVCLVEYHFIFRDSVHGGAPFYFL